MSRADLEGLLRRVAGTELGQALGAVWSYGARQVELGREEAAMGAPVEAADEGAAGRLPPKLDGVHRWIAIATYTISHGQVAAIERADRVMLDHENRLGVDVGCIDCEQPYQAAKRHPCPTPPPGWQPG